MSLPDNRELHRRFPREAKLVDQLNQAARKAGMDAKFILREHSMGQGANIILQTNTPEQVQQLIQAINLA